jgi:hypothetical protein
MRNALEVHREHRVPIALLHLVQPAQAARDAGVVDADIDVAIDRKCYKIALAYERQRR